MYRAFVNTIVRKMSSKVKKDFVVLFQGDGLTEENKYAKSLEGENIRSKNIPVLSFDFINVEKLRSCLKDSDRYGGIIFTSTRSVKAISNLLVSPNDLCIDEWREKCNFSVGKATADHAVSALNIDTFGSDSGNSENLCRVIIDKYAFLSKPLLFPCSDIRKDTIPDTLTKQGVLIEEVVCYKTVPNKNLESSWHNLVSEDGLPVILVFFSPSGVESCLKIILAAYEHSSLPVFIALGPSTEKSLNNYLMPCIVAEKPTPEALTEVVKKYLHNQ